LKLVSRVLWLKMHVMSLWDAKISYLMFRLSRRYWHNELNRVVDFLRCNSVTAIIECVSIIIIIIIINLFAIFSYQIADIYSVSYNGRPPEKHNVQLAGGL